MKTVALLLWFVAAIPAFAEDHGYLDQAAENFSFSRPDGSATFWDVGKCTLLAEGAAIVLWYSAPVIRGLGQAGHDFNEVLVRRLAIDKKLATGIEIILAAWGVKVMPSSWIKEAVRGIGNHPWTPQVATQFFENGILPGFEACRRISSDFASLPYSLAELMTSRDFSQRRPEDSTGVRNGKHCAERSDGLFGGGWQACVACCSAKLQGNGHDASLPACRAVCNVQFR